LSCLVLAASIVSPNWLPSQCSTQAVDSHEHHLHACARHLLHACPRVCACEQYYCKRNLFSCNSARQQSPTWAARTREQKDPEAACDPQPRDFVRCVCEREREREERERERETSLQRETCPLRHRAVKIACPSCSVCASKVGKAVRKFSSRLFAYQCTLGAKETECDQDLTWLAAGVLMMLS